MSCPEPQEPIRPFSGNPPGFDGLSGQANEVAVFDVLLADAQVRIRGYLASILGGWAEVDDLLQETNLVLIRKQAEFKPGTNFIAWAFRVAYFKATTWRRDRGREGRVVFREHEFQEIAAAAEDYFTSAAPMVEALTRCIEKLPLADRELIHHKYLERQSLTDLASALGCRANTLHKTISRIRLALRKCIRETHERRASP